MKIGPDIVRTLRERRAWSQEQLAEIAGLSVRTVQRVETGGGASLETRMALSAAHAWPDLATERTSPRFLSSSAMAESI